MAGWLSVLYVGKRVRYRLLKAVLISSFGLGGGSLGGGRAIAQVSVFPRSQPTPLAQAAPRPPAVCLATLPTAVRQITERPIFGRGRWGILVQTLAAEPRDRQTLVAQDIDHFFIPASNNKLLTTAAALHRLGPNYRIRTAIYGDLTQPNPVLRVVGRGDPTFGPAQMQDLARQLKARGVTRIGLLRGDDSHFPGPAVNPNWDWEDVQAGYGAPVNSLIYAQNAIGLTLSPQQIGQPLHVQWEDAAEADRWRLENRSRTVAPDAEEFLALERDGPSRTIILRGELRAGSEPATVAIAVPDPADRFLQKLRQALTQTGITVLRTEVTTTPGAIAAPEVAAVESPPLRELLPTVNQVSDNLFAEALLKTLSTLSPDPAATAFERGVFVLRTILTTLAIAPDTYATVDGSGLARRNLVTPTVLVALLQTMAQTPNATVFRNSLATPGGQGTLRSRLRDTPAAGRVQAKTGTLTDVVSLSGYLTTLDNQQLVFSILVNHTGQPTRTVRQAVDEIVLLLVRARRC